MRGNGYLGPTRASFMTWVADQVGMQDMGRAQAEAYLKSTYGDAFKLPEQPRIVSGGSVDTGQHISIPPDVPEPGPVVVKQRWRRPKITGLGPWLFASVLVGAGVLIWLYSHGAGEVSIRPAPAGPSVPATGGSGLDLEVTPPYPPLAK